MSVKMVAMLLARSAATLEPRIKVGTRTLVDSVMVDSGERVVGVEATPSGVDRRARSRRARSWSGVKAVDIVSAK